MREHFREYIGRVEDYLKATYENFDMNFFYINVFHVIKSFLNEPDSNILFIKIPVHELGLTPKDYDENWTKLQGVVSDALCEATSRRQRELVACPELTPDNEGSIIFCEDAIHRGYGHFFRIVRSGFAPNGISLKPIFDGSKLNLTVSAKIDWYNAKKDRFFRMKSEPPSFDQRVFSQVSSVYKRIINYSRNAFTSQYNSAVIVGFNDRAKVCERMYDNAYFSSPVKFSNKFEYGLLENDIICFVGDRKYNGWWDDVQRSIGQGKVKKAIFIGIQLEYFSESDVNRLYSFSVRDLYHWFAGGDFPEINFKKLPFSWLEERIREINDIIDDIKDISEDQRKRIISYSLWNFVGLKIREIDQKAIDNLSNFIYENTNISNEDEDKILNWFRNLSFDGRTPKQMFLEEFARYQNPFIVHLGSYERRLNEFLKTNNNKNGTLVFDVLSDSKKYGQLITDVWRHMPVTDLYLISYFNMDKIASFLKTESELCNQDYRVKLLNGIKLDTSEYVLPPLMAEDNLSNYFSSDLFSEYSSNHIVELGKQQRYRVTSSNGDIVELIGDVVVGKTIVPLSEICNDYNEEDFPLDVQYYEKPQHFDLVFEIVKNFPKGKDVAHYSRLWKEIMKEYCDTKYGGDYKKCMKEQFPFLPKSQARQYVNPDSITDFPNEFPKTVRQMKKLGLIDETTGKFLISAKKANLDRTKIGGQLKESLYQLETTGERSTFLTAFDEKSKSRGETLTSDDLLRDCIKIIQINNIIAI